MILVRLAIGSTRSGSRRNSTRPSSTSNTRTARGGFLNRGSNAFPPVRRTGAGERASSDPPSSGTTLGRVDHPGPGARAVVAR